MAYVITQKCVGTCDTACVDVCPCDCIIGPVPRDELRGGKLPGVQMFIDPDECIDCGACIAECPVAAIELDRDAPPADVERNAAFFRSRTR
jgi:ferredoxin